MRDWGQRITPNIHFNALYGSPLLLLCHPCFYCITSAFIVSRLLLLYINFGSSRCLVSFVEQTSRIPDGN